VTREGCGEKIKGTVFMGLPGVEPGLTSPPRPACLTFAVLPTSCPCIDPYPMTRCQQIDRVWHFWLCALLCVGCGQGTLAWLLLFLYNQLGWCGCIVEFHYLGYSGIDKSTEKRHIPRRLDTYHRSDFCRLRVLNY
jgi:hypothetical protein